MSTFSIGSFNPNFSGSGTYQSAANMNMQLWNALQAGYQQRMGQFQAGMAGVQSGWNNLEGQVLGQLHGANRANLQDIANKYTALSGTMSNQMIDRGLANSTVQDAMQIGLQGSKSREMTASRGTFANLLANTISQIGGSALGSQERGVTGASDIYGGYLGALGAISAPYPQNGMYSGYSGGGGAPTVIGGGRPIGGFAPPSYQAGSVDSGGGGGGGWGLADYAQASANRLASSPYAFNGDSGGGGNNALGGVAGAMSMFGQPSGPGFWAGLPSQLAQGGYASAGGYGEPSGASGEEY